MVLDQHPQKSGQGPLVLDHFFIFRVVFFPFFLKTRNEIPRRKAMTKLNLEQISVQLDRDNLKTLRHLAVDADMSTSEIVREAVQEYLARRAGTNATTEEYTKGGGI
jgi:hypothetical protein